MAAPAAAQVRKPTTIARMYTITIHSGERAYERTKNTDATVSSTSRTTQIQAVTMTGTTSSGS
jgi:hypothetical protein